MKKAISKSADKAGGSGAEYPEGTHGSRVAHQLREEANKLTETQRADLFKQGMQIIYGGPGQKKKTGVRH